MKSPDNIGQFFFVVPRLLIQALFFGRPIFLVSRLSGIGDIVCTLPSVGTLKSLWPNSIMVYETSRPYLALVRGCRHVDIPVEQGSLLALLLRATLKPGRKFYPLLPDERRPPQPREPIHLVEEFRKSFGLESLIEPVTRLEVSPQAAEEVRQRLKQELPPGTRLVVVHTGPTWKVKEWPLEKWRELCDQLRSPGQVSVIQIGENKTAYGEKRGSPIGAGAINWTGKLTLDQTLALLSLADLVVGVDSGVLQMAGAVDAPCIGIFGPTLPNCFLPRTSQAAGITSNVPCLGCHHAPQGPLHWQSGCPYDIRCMAELSADAVLAACLKVLRP